MKSTWPGCIRSYSTSIGSLTLRIISDSVQTGSQPSTTLAPAAPYASSGIEEPTPAPDWTSTSWPRLVSSCTPEGVIATRNSLFLTSLGTPTFTRHSWFETPGRSGPPPASAALLRRGEHRRVHPGRAGCATEGRTQCSELGVGRADRPGGLRRGLVVARGLAAADLLGPARLDQRHVRRHRTARVVPGGAAHALRGRDDRVRLAGRPTGPRRRRSTASVGPLLLVVSIFGLGDLLSPFEQEFCQRADPACSHGPGQQPGRCPRRHPQHGRLFALVAAGFVLASAMRRVPAWSAAAVPRGC